MYYDRPDDIERIKNNKYINNLEEDCAKFGVYGVYVPYFQNVNPSRNGWYFVMGLDKEKVINECMDINKILETQKRDSKFYHIDIAAVCLSDYNPPSVAMDVLRFAANAEFIKKVHEQFDKPVPPKVNNAILFLMKASYNNSIDLSLKPGNMEYYRSALQEYFKAADATIDPNNPEYEKKQFILNGYADSNKFANYIKRKYGDKNTYNEVSLEKVVMNSDKITRHSIDAKYLPALKKELSTRPDILYHCMKVEQLDFDTTGKTTRGNADNISTVDVIYNSLFESDVSYMMFKSVYPELSEFTVDKMKSERGLKDKDIRSVGLCETDFIVFVNECYKQGLNPGDYVVNEHNIRYEDNSGLICISYDKNVAPQIDKALSVMVLDAKKEHFYKNYGEELLDSGTIADIENDVDDVKSQLKAKGINYDENKLKQMVAEMRSLEK